jgi:WhiB family redox-sensing transcriptional regulator
MSTEDWRELALCAQVGLDMFFPEKGESSRPAKSICHRCEVTAECLASAMKNGERFGIWGGVAVRDRRKLRRATSPTELPASTLGAS